MNRLIGIISFILFLFVADSGVRKTFGVVVLDPYSVNAYVCDLTEADVKGPFWFPGSPERFDIREPGDGPLLDLYLEVVDHNCMSIPLAWIDVWHTDPNGDYDNKGWIYRGHHYSDEQGESLLKTIVPAFYPGRTKHIHVKVQGSTKDVHTTQLYFPDVVENESDSFYRPELEIEVLSEDLKGNMIGMYQFVLDEKTIPSCDEDVDGSGVVDVIDLLSVVSSLGPCEGCAEDIDDSGNVNVFDILAVVSGWGSCS